MDLNVFTNRVEHKKASKAIAHDNINVKLATINGGKIQYLHVLTNNLMPFLFYFTIGEVTYFRKVFFFKV